MDTTPIERAAESIVFKISEETTDPLKMRVLNSIALTYRDKPLNWNRVMSRSSDGGMLNRFMCTPSNENFMTAVIAFSKWGNPIAVSNHPNEMITNSTLYYCTDHLGYSTFLNLRTQIKKEDRAILPIVVHVTPCKNTETGDDGYSVHGTVSSTYFPNTPISNVFTLITRTGADGDYIEDLLCGDPLQATYRWVPSILQCDQTTCLAENVLSLGIEVVSII